MLVPTPIDFDKVGHFFYTWVLISLNIFVFILISSKPVQTDEKKIDKLFLQIGGQLYSQWGEQNIQRLPDWWKNLDKTKSEHLQIMGAWAMRDERFIKKVQSVDFFGDQVAIEFWKKKVKELGRQQDSLPSFVHGFHPSHNNWHEWLSYQFTHSSVWHLLGNMVFLFLAGLAVEALVGGPAMLFIYIFGGFAGAYAFLLSQDGFTTPMVGASASISALMSFYAISESKARIRFFYFMAPFDKHYGFIYLSPLIIFLVFMLKDLTQWLESPTGLGDNVAYVAHIGGALIGLTIGFFHRFIRFDKILTRS
jgi:membrane associated rhomboid family serine protease